MSPQEWADIHNVSALIGIIGSPLAIAAWFVYRRWRRRPR